MKKQWERKTRMCDYTQVKPGLRNTIENELKEMQEDLNIILCIETESTELKKANIFSKSHNVKYTAVIITPSWLVQAVDLGNKKELYAIFHYLDKMQVNFETMEHACGMGIDEYGITVFSQTRWNLRGGSIFIGLEQGAAAEQFIETLQKTIEAATQ